MKPSSVRIVSVLLLLIVLGLVQATRGSAAQDLDEDRPPIIVSSGSVIIQSTGAWTSEGGKRFKQRDGRRRGVRLFMATTGSCRVEGRNIVVTYGKNQIRLGPSRTAASNRDDAELEFPADADVTETAPGTLRVTTSDPLVSVASGRDRCDVSGNITIRQIR
jgi:hypothetical protein